MLALLGWLGLAADGTAAGAGTLLATLDDFAEEVSVCPPEPPSPAGLVAAV
jgi:hypothetical protein